MPEQATVLDGPGAGDFQMEIPTEATPVIVQKYRDLLDKLKAIAEKDRFWRETLTHPAMKDFMEDCQHKVDEIKLSWGAPDYKPKDFANDHAQVVAKDFMIYELRRQNFGDQLRSLKREIAQFEINNEVILEQYGYSFNREANREILADAPDPDATPNEAPGDIEPDELEEDILSDEEMDDLSGESVFTKEERDAMADDEQALADSTIPQPRRGRPRKG